MAVITQTSDGDWRHSTRQFFGQSIPEHVVNVKVFRDLYPHDELMVGWITIDGNKYSMPFEQTDKGVTAALVAMTLSC